MAFVNSVCLHRVTGVVFITFFYVTIDININLTNSINLSMFSVCMGACCDFIHAGSTEYILRQLYISNEL